MSSVDDSVAQKLNECYRHTISLCHEFLQNRDPDDRDCCVLRRAYRYAKGAARAGRATDLRPVRGGQPRQCRVAEVGAEARAEVEGAESRQLETTKCP